MTISERRTQTRIGAFLPCKISAGPQTYPARLLDVSLGGAYVNSRYVPGRGESISISAELPGQGKKITVHGSVLRVTRYTSDHGDACRFAVRFGGVTPESMMLVKEVASQNK